MTAKKDAKKQARAEEAARQRRPYEMVDAAAWEKGFVGEKPRRVLPEALQRVRVGPGEELLLECVGGREASPALRTELLALVRTNMQQAYSRASWGWNERRKELELAHDDARHVVLREPGGNVVGFVHIRFLVEDGEPVLYLYEIQVAPDRARKGVGKRLMTLVEMVARATKMARIKLTVLRSNESAIAFYAKLGFDEDDDSPGEDEGKDYLILGKGV